jgi:8-amino-7-oxononanoate synthase
LFLRFIEIILAAKVRHSFLMKILGPTKVELDGKVVTSFAGTNYLGLSFHPRILAALEQVARRSGFGLGASRRTTGTTDEVLELENRVAAFAGAEAALVTTSGTLANAGVVDGLKGSIDCWLIDEQAHPSFARFLPLSAARVQTYRHLDVEDLTARLGWAQGRVGIFSDAVFPLTGEIAPVARIAEASGEALVVFDEAHSMGILGTGGRGLTQGLGERVLVTGTFTKALGCSGGMILGAARWIDFIREGSDLLASTSALPPAAAAAATAALAVVESEPQLLWKLHANIRLMRDGLKLAPLDRAAPIFFSHDNALELSERALEAGFLVPAVAGYPGAPASGMLRWIVSSEHTQEEIRNVFALLNRP